MVDVQRATSVSFFRDTVYEQVCVQPRSSAVNTTLPARAVKCCAAAQLLPSAGRAAGTRHRRPQLSVDLLPTGHTHTPV